MKTLMLTVTFLLISSFQARAQDVSAHVRNELAFAVVQTDIREVARATNRIIRMGEAAVPSLIEALTSAKADLSTKWLAAEALGQIGSAQATDALQVCLSDENSWLKGVCQNSLALIKGEKPRAGKVYLWTQTDVLTKTDVENGTTEIVPKPN